MGKFEVGHKIVRVANPQSFVPIGYESVVKEPYRYIDGDGVPTPIIDKYWELAEDKSKYHKHHDLIIQWAKGAVLECRYEGDIVWDTARNPTFRTRMEYRVKPTPPKTDQERIAELEKRVKELEQSE